MWRAVLSSAEHAACTGARHLLWHAGLGPVRGAVPDGGPAAEAAQASAASCHSPPEIKTLPLPQCRKTLCSLLGRLVGAQACRLGLPNCRAAKEAAALSP